MIQLLKSEIEPGGLLAKAITKVVRGRTNGYNGKGEAQGDPPGRNSRLQI